MISILQFKAQLLVLRIVQCMENGQSGDPGVLVLKHVELL